MVIAPDSFKGTLGSGEAARALADGLRSLWPSAELQCFAMADGGEGTLEALAHCWHTQPVVTEVRDACGGRQRIEYARSERPPPLALIEAARVIGLVDAPGDVNGRSSEGLGDCLLAELERGTPRIVVGLGGTSTIDGGAGMLSVLGVRFLDRQGRLLRPCPQALWELHRVDGSRLDTRLRALDLTVFVDVDAPLLGPMGAAALFGPQKGLRPPDLGRYEQMLSVLANGYRALHPHARPDAPGAGAAGGLGLAFLCLGARLSSGAHAIAGLTGLKAALTQCDWVLTGEGRSDRQTRQGKVPWVVAELARAAGKPVTLVAGEVLDAPASGIDTAFSDWISLADLAGGVDAAKADTRHWLAQAARVLAARRSGHGP